VRLGSGRSGRIDLVTGSGSRDRHRFRRSLDKNSIKDTRISSPRRETRTRTRATPRHRHSKPKKCARANKNNNTPFRDPSSEPRKHVHRKTNGQRWYPPCPQAPAFHHPPYYFQNTFHTFHLITSRRQNEIRYPNGSSTRIW